ncbi:MAG: hypothetical protein ACREP9_02740 [Candidatus Dormibacteraceae bacterium]
MEGYVTLWIIGVIFLAGAAIGLGLKAGGIEIPVITSRPARALLAITGTLGIVLGFVAFYQSSGNLTSTSPEKGPGSSPSAAPETSNYKPGDLVFGCTRDLPSNQVLLFDGECPQPTTKFNSDYDLRYVVTSDGKHEFSTYGQLAVLEAPAASYGGCRNDTRYAKDFSVTEGTILCFTGHGLIAGIRVREFHSSPTTYATLHIAVWRGQ